VSVIAVPSDLSYERLLAEFWHQGHREDHEDLRPMTPAQDRLEQLLQTELYWDPRWCELYGVWGAISCERHPQSEPGCLDCELQFALRGGSALPPGLMVGSWEVLRRNSRGEVVDRWRSAQIITTTGKTNLANYLSLVNGSHSTTIDPYMKFLGVGTSATAVAVGDNALGGANGPGPSEVQAATGSLRLTGTGSNTTNVYQEQATSVAGQITGNPTLQEAGMFNASGIQTVANTPVGTCYDRSLLVPSATVATTDTIQVTFQITFS
jgi:hypothetical protein